MIFNFLRKQTKDSQRTMTAQALNTIELVEKVVTTTEKTATNLTAPLRQQALKRFPVLFSLLAVFGGAATFLGLEQVLLQYQIFQDFPGLLLLIGIITLIFTGKLYKKL